MIQHTEDSPRTLPLTTQRLALNTLEGVWQGDLIFLPDQIHEKQSDLCAVRAETSC